MSVRQNSQRRHSCAWIVRHMVILIYIFLGLLLCHLDCWFYLLDYIHVFKLVDVKICGRFTLCISWNIQIFKMVLNVFTLNRITEYIKNQDILVLTAILYYNLYYNTYFD